MNTKKVFVGAAAVLSLSALTLAGCGNNSSKKAATAAALKRLRCRLHTTTRKPASRAAL